MRINSQEKKEERKKKERGSGGVRLVWCDVMWWFKDRRKENTNEEID